VGEAFDLCSSPFLAETCANSKLLCKNIGQLRLQDPRCSSRNTTLRIYYFFTSSINPSFIHFATFLRYRLQQAPYSDRVEYNSTARLVYCLYCCDFCTFTFAPPPRGLLFVIHALSLSRAHTHTHTHTLWLL
jgi:hypothetical protein